jgi:hypothetical protein
VIWVCKKQFAAVHNSKYIGLKIKVNIFLLRCSILFPAPFSSAVAAQRKMLALVPTGYT